MADLSGFNLEQNQAILRAELDQEIREAWENFYWHGEEWLDRFTNAIDGLAEVREPRIQAIAKLARIGFLHMLESHVDADESGKIPGTD